ncbi:amidohydrolase family protein [Flavilitoribacter nigricans]|uniref:Amidohydrolase n=1 Tax=Flavilitoribacter nigricans (strain ATCC 23147 / DSM 23189 / NBRC 102662 / NCIMB 1420 / SS-2) TaxID=1122177 RepID=A0A2D0N4A8_FLAN2|nr:amidohydrolase family protein [Flavilitoribacter nigricans]PHN02603.1 amidohydrolase [Flavilitoribacter nigricans DSM 23189 = NBRC 102662]
MKKLTLLLLYLVGMSGLLQAQETFPVNDVQDVRSKAYAFTNATVFTSSDTKVEGATLLIRNGKIEGVGKGLSVPQGYTTVDLGGKFIYPSFIDMYTNYGMPEAERSRGGGFGGAEQIQSNTAGAYNGNEAIKSEFNAAEVFTVNDRDAKGWRDLGFGSVLSFRSDGLARGTSTLVTLADNTPNQVVLDPKTAAHYSFNKGSSRQNYPSSAMGYISLLKQTYLDAEWYGSFAVQPFTDLSLQAWNNTQSMPQIFEANNWVNILRADKLGDEFGVQYIMRSGGDSYQRLDEVKATGASLIVPLNFPDAYNVDDPIDAYKVSLENMKHWELAPANLSYLEKAGIDFALTVDGLSKKSDFWSNLRKAIDYGLSEDAALKALTEVPAKLMGVADMVGSLKEGMVANFIITSGNVFDEDATIYENWIQGKPYKLNDMVAPDLSGQYVLALGGDSYDLEISGKPGRPQAKIVVNDTTDVKVNLSLDEEMVSLSFNPDPKDKEGGMISLSGWIQDKSLAGTGQMSNGAWVDWSANYADPLEAKGERGGRGGSDKAPELGEVIYPFVAYGNKEVPQQENILIKNATVWTMEEAGMLENTDVLLENGKITQIGKNLAARGARVIDGTGKHLSPGIIDEHSHIGASSINDRATNSSMVRIGDVVDSEDQEIYRALSGGVTAIQILHGSANPIGGQSALIKLRWGHAPESMKIDNADGFIKFALGENVKRSRSDNSIRYPQTRMGVEQVYVDAFQSARDYEKKWKTYNALSASAKAKAEKPRKDLAMETMLEILNKERFITCHSYVQSEINMLMKVAEQFDFRINTFTHILEGYKVADKMAEHGVGASTFSDWWAYKWEVRYAIPYNSTIMMREGVVTAVNSDNASLMRRLNQEAAKAVKYGDLDPYEAFKMATINPATLLHLDDRMGSIKVGKDADVVLWSDNPLSIYAQAEKTIVDGTVFYDMEKDQEMKKEIREERARLVQKMRDAKSKGGSTRPARATYRHHWECDDVHVYEGN